LYAAVFIRSKTDGRLISLIGLEASQVSLLTAADIIAIVA
jgi:hypothetical protein